MKKPRTPEDLAKKTRGKDKYTLYLDVNLMDYIKDRATRAGSNASQVVNEAITAYVEFLKEKEKKK